MDDALHGAEWWCCETAAGALHDPGELGATDVDWLPARVPGTAAGALRDAGRWSWDSDRDLDATDWWFRCRFQVADASDRALALDGLASVADVWLDGRHLLSSENMFTRRRVDAGTLDPGPHDLVIRFAALGPMLEARRPRPRWRTRLVRHHNLRWFRTSALGRMPGWSPGPAPVGPWRPVRLVRSATVVERRWQARVEGDDGVLDVDVVLAADARPRTVVAVVGEARVTLEPADGDTQRLRGTVRVPGVRRWWPHTHGTPERYDVGLDVDGVAVPMGRVGFRSVEVDRGDGDGFGVVVNGVPVFCRGGGWVPPDVVSLAAPPDDVRAALVSVRDAGLNMVRVLGTMVYEDDVFWDLCDELGLLVWLDCMFANSDPPDDDAFLAGVEAELRDVFAALQGRPSLTVVCGGSEVEQQAAMVGLPAERRAMPLFDQLVPRVLEESLPGTPYVPSTPTGGALPFHPNAGVAHYYGVGAYRRPVEDARRAGVRFAAECLAFSIPPEPAAVDDAFGSQAVSGHHPRWKAGVPRDAGAPWDFEDVRDHYVAELFGIDPRTLRMEDAERWLDLGRAACAHLIESVVAEWRRPGSPCAGALTLLLRDLRPGAGWGVLDHRGIPKAPWWGLARASAPLAVLLTDEGLNGLHAHVVNDGPAPYRGDVEVALHTVDGLKVEEAVHPVAVDAASGTSFSVDALFDGFRDLNHAYRFGPRAYDTVTVRLVDATDPGGDAPGRRAVHLVGGLDRPVVPSVDLAATLVDEDGRWSVEVTTGRLAQWVVVEIPGWRAVDSWFHLEGGGNRRVGLRPELGTDPGMTPQGAVRALNARAGAKVSP